MEQSNQFKFTTGEDNVNYACPIEIEETGGRVPVQKLDECVEADVVGRYSGAIEIVNR